MCNDNRLINASQLKPGDVLLCVVEGDLAQRVERATESNYSHAAICYSSTEIVHVELRGIKKIPIELLVRGTKHIAVFRNPYLWRHPLYVEALKGFLDKAIQNNVRYDRGSAEELMERRADHHLTLLAKLHAHFLDGLEPQSHEKLKYICSEFIVACFTGVGFIKPNARILYQCDTYTPADLGRDPTFGFLVGYIKHGNDYEIPTNDEFAKNVTLHETQLAELGDSGGIEAASENHAVGTGIG